MSCFLLLFNLDYCLCETLSSWERLSFTLHIIFPLVPLRKSCALRDNCLVYITSLVSDNYLGSNNCSVENKFHLIVNVLFPIALQLRLLSVWNIIQLRTSIFTVTSFFPFAPLQKCCANRDNSLVYSISLVSNNYPGSNKSSVENDFHLQVNVLFPIVLQFRLLSVWNIIQLRTSIFYTSHHFPPCSSSEKLCFAR